MLGGRGIDGRGGLVGRRLSENWIFGFHCKLLIFFCFFERESYPNVAAVFAPPTGPVTGGLAILTLPAHCLLFSLLAFAIK